MEYRFFFRLLTVVYFSASLTSVIQKPRKKALLANIKKLFWIRVFTNTVTISVIISLFFVHRGVSKSEIFYLWLVWALVVLVSEVPSSKLADEWGRKNTIVLGCLFLLVRYVIMIFGEGFSQMMLSMIALGFFKSCMSGTSEALLYDSLDEAGEKSRAAKSFGVFSSAFHLPKIITTIVAVFMAKDLTENQFVAVLCVDALFSFGATLLSLTLVEADHVVNRKEGDKTVTDAWNMLWEDRFILHSVLNRDLVFVPVFGIMVIYQVYFVGLQVSVITIGIIWMLYRITTFFIQREADFLARKFTESGAINMLNASIVVSFWLFLLLAFMEKLSVVQLVLCAVFVTATVVRFPLFTKVLNDRYDSYNRATSISLGSSVSTFLQIPVFALASLFVDVGFVPLFFFLYLVILTTVVLLPFPKSDQAVT